ncbi:MAG TPA: carboxypeptidase-like regulatory domain-containing protein [Gemmatimonadaceae bacterium]|nr:carboxypeptidase-like regulatory domain-containing protein [Gemmatimonadaceae bacterium]
MRARFAAPLMGALIACSGRPRPAALRAEVALPPAPAVGPGHTAVIGVVADSALGYPVEGAVVFFTDDTTLLAVDPRPAPGLPVDTAGRGGGFVLRDAPAGMHALAATRIGYLPELRFVALHAGRVDTVIVRLRRRQ